MNEYFFYVIIKKVNEVFELVLKYFFSNFSFNVH